MMEGDDERRDIIFIKSGRKKYRFRRSDRKIGEVSGFEVWDQTNDPNAEWVNIKVIDFRRKVRRVSKWRSFVGGYSAAEKRMARGKTWGMLCQLYPEIGEQILNFMNEKYGKAN